MIPVLHEESLAECVCEDKGVRAGEQDTIVGFEDRLLPWIFVGDGREPCVWPSVMVQGGGVGLCERLLRAGEVCVLRAGLPQASEIPAARAQCFVDSETGPFKVNLG